MVAIMSAVEVENHFISVGLSVDMGRVSLFVSSLVPQSELYFPSPRKGLPTGMLSGAMGQFLASPTDLVKIRLQMEGRRQLDGLKPR